MYFLILIRHVRQEKKINRKKIYFIAHVSIGHKNKLLCLHYLAISFQNSLLDLYERAYIWYDE